MATIQNYSKTNQIKLWGIGTYSKIFENILPSFLWCCLPSNFALIRKIPLFFEKKKMYLF